LALQLADRAADFANEQGCQSFIQEAAGEFGSPLRLTDVAECLHAVGYGHEDLAGVIKAL